MITKNKKIVYQGIEGSYSYLVGIKYFGSKNIFIGVNNFKEIFKNVEERKADFGVVPIENSIAGSVYENFDNLNKFKVKVIGECYLEIEHHLLGIKAKLPFNLRIKFIKKIYSHPKALEQCNKFLDKYPYIEKIAYSDTASAAKLISELNDITIACIANKECAKIYNLEILRENIQDNRNNLTRFLIISSKQINIPHTNKASLIFTLPHIPGSLYNALKIFAEFKINLTKIESRPIPEKPFEYFFFVDFIFSKDVNLNYVLKEFKKKVNRIKILGIYESGERK
jgi:chorismate mutase/prephenate dehydratase